MPRTAPRASATLRATAAMALFCGAAHLAPRPWSFLVAPPATLPGAAPPVVDASAARPIPSNVASGEALFASTAVVGTVAAIVAQRGRFRRGRGPAVWRRGGGAEGNIEDAVPFEIRGFSLSQLVLGIGFGLIVYCFGDYYITSSNGGGSGLSSLFFIYALPAITLGAALSSAELEPVPVEAEPGADELYERLATDTLRKIESDVTRHRYGDDAHLDSSLKALGLIVKGSYPKLLKIIKSASPEGELQFTMLFESKRIPFYTWSDEMRIKSYDRFFGPGVWASVFKYSSEEKIAALTLTTGKRPESPETGGKEAVSEGQKEAAMTSSTA